MDETNINTIRTQDDVLKFKELINRAKSFL